MALTLGFARKGEEREGIWIDDPSLKDVPEHARAEWLKDGAAAHLKPYVVNGQPTIFKFRELEIDEAFYLEDFRGHFRLMLFKAFCLGVRFPDAKEVVVDGAGEKIPVMEANEVGMAVLSKAFAKHLDRKYPGIVEAYGLHIFRATFPSEPEKKASSPQSTKPSSEGVDATKGSTAETTKAADTAA